MSFRTSHGLAKPFTSLPCMLLECSASVCGKHFAENRDMSYQIQVASGRGLASEEVEALVGAGAVAMIAERTSTSESLSIFVTSLPCNFLSAGEGSVAGASDANDDVVKLFRRLGLAFFGFVRNTDCSFWPTCKVPCRMQESHVETTTCKT